MNGEKKQTVSLILGSGGARGLSHIGVIHELEKQGFDIQAVVGCSMGALIGGFYCAGHLGTYEDWVTKLTEWDVMRFLDISLTSRAGMMKGDLIMETLRDLIGDVLIEDLPIAYTAVATDILSKKEVWLNSGKLFDAIRASIAVPGIFTPKVIDNFTLVDGGLLNPLPAAPAVFNKTDLTIAVNLSGRDMVEPLGPNPPDNATGTLEKYRNQIDGVLGRIQNKLGLEPIEDSEKAPELGLTDVLLGMFDTMQSAIARHRMASYPPDLLIEIPGNICGSHEFYKARSVIAAGRYWAQHAMSKQSYKSQILELGMQ